LLALFSVGCRVFAGNPEVLTTFALHEDFGVLHPGQIVCFGPVANLVAGKVALFDEQGNPAPIQGLLY
jgi:hypothetical protein